MVITKAESSSSFEDYELTKSGTKLVYKDYGEYLQDYLQYHGNANRRIDEFLSNNKGLKDSHNEERLKERVLAAALRATASNSSKMNYKKTSKLKVDTWDFGQEFETIRDYMKTNNFPAPSDLDYLSRVYELKKQIHLNQERPDSQKLDDIELLSAAISQLENADDKIALYKDILTDEKFSTTPDKNLKAFALKKYVESKNIDQKLILKLMESQLTQEFEMKKNGDVISEIETEIMQLLAKGLDFDTKDEGDSKNLLCGKFAYFKKNVFQEIPMPGEKNKFGWGVEEATTYHDEKLYSLKRMVELKASIDIPCKGGLTVRDQLKAMHSSYLEAALQSKETVPTLETSAPETSCFEITDHTFKEISIMAKKGRKSLYAEVLDGPFFLEAGIFGVGMCSYRIHQTREKVGDFDFYSIRLDIESDTELPIVGEVRENNLAQFLKKVSRFVLLDKAEEP